MVRHHQREHEANWKRGVVINAVGSCATAIVLVIVAATKFTKGAWVPIVVVPLIIALFSAIKRHYDRVSKVLAVTPDDVRPVPINHTVVVLVGRIHKGVLKAIAYAKSLNPQHLLAVYVSYEDEDREDFEKQWEKFHIDIPLEIVHSPYRELVSSVENFIAELDARWDNDTVTVVIPEFVVGKWYEQILHNQSALLLKGKLLFREGIVVTSVPYHVDTDNGQGESPVVEATKG
jgi:hypothetical protein